MAAFGGKSVNGEPKESHDRKDGFDEVRGVTTVLGCRSEVRDLQKRNKDAEKKSTRMAMRGGRIFREESAARTAGQFLDWLYRVAQCECDQVMVGSYFGKHRDELLRELHVVFGLGIR